MAGWDVYASQIAIGIAAALVLTTVNVWGISTAARLQGFVTVLILLSGAVLISGASINGGMENMTPLFENGLTGTLGVLVMIPILFVGFDVIPQAAEEIDLAPARIGGLVVFSVISAAAFYVLVLLAVGYLLGPSARAHSTLTTADAAAAAWSGTSAGTVLVCGGASPASSRVGTPFSSPPAGSSTPWRQAVCCLPRWPLWTINTQVPRGPCG